MTSGILPHDQNFIPILGAVSAVTDKASSIKALQYDADTRGLTVHVVGDDAGIMLGTDFSTVFGEASLVSATPAVKVEEQGTVAVTGTFWQTTQPVSLASVPSHAVTNAGTFAVQPGTALTGPGNPVVDSYTTAAINIADGANNQIVATPGASKQIWVYAIFGTMSAAGTWSLQDEDDAVLSGVIPFAANSGPAMPASGNFAMPIFKVATNKALEIDLSGADFDGFVTYGIISV